jgi:hypothetical protein
MSLVTRTGGTNFSHVKYDLLTLCSCGFARNCCDKHKNNIISNDYFIYIFGIVIEDKICYLYNSRNNSVSVTTFNVAVWQDNLVDIAA